MHDKTPVGNLHAMLPSGTVTFLFTDIAGSTARWESNPEAMRAALAEHNLILAAVFAENRGYVFKTVGDAFCVAFESAGDAVASSFAAHERLSRAHHPLTIRVGIHTGEIVPTGDDYFGPPVNKVARIQAACNPGQTLASEATKGLLGPDISVKDLGRHTLKDLLEPTQIWQVGEGSFPPIKSLSASSNNLPVLTTSFVGREREMGQLATLLASSRLITLTGAGGTGKSRLAIQFAADNLERFPDGIWFIELAPLLDRSDVIREVVKTVGVKTGDESPEERLERHLANQTCLLILDNCEHVLDEVCAVAESIQRRCPGVSLIATSREPLGAQGERVYAVPSLAAPSAERRLTMDDLLHFGSTALFIDRLASAAPEQQISSAQAPTIANICERLDGIPLAIELAAARGRSMTLQEIEKRLNDRFRLLTGGRRTAVSRQQTLRALIDWSVNLLTDQQRGFFVSLGVFVGGWDLESAEHVCADEDRGIDSLDIADLLAALVDKSLVGFDSTKGRYHLLESMRHYALEELESQDWALDLRDRHARYFLSFADEFVDNSESVRSDRFKRFFENIENHRAAIEWLSGDDANISKLVRSLIKAYGGWYWIRRTDEYTKLLGALLERAEGHIDAEELLAARCEHMSNLVMLGDPHAEGLLEDCIAAFVAGGPRVAGRNAIMAGYALFFLGQHERAISMLELYVPVMPDSLRAGGFHVLSNAYASVGRYREALETFATSAGLLLAEKSWLDYQHPAGAMIVCWVLLGRFREAIERALDLVRFKADHEFAMTLGSYQSAAFAHLAIETGEHWFAALLHAKMEARRVSTTVLNDPFDLLAIRTVQEMVEKAVEPSLLAKAARSVNEVDLEPWLRSLLPIRVDDIYGEGPRFPNAHLLPRQPVAG